MDVDKRRVASLITILAGSGVMHFAVPAPYRKIVPPGFGDPDTMVKLSGVIELACAGLVALPATRRAGGLLSAGLFVAVFPANVYSVQMAGDNKWLRLGAIARLPLQIPMVKSALAVARTH